MAKEKTSGYTSNVIWTVGGNGRFMDAKAALSQSSPDDPFMMHSPGGSGQKPTSSIILSMTNYAKDGSSSVYTEVRTKPSVLAMCKEVCIKNLRTAGNGVTADDPAAVGRGLFNLFNAGRTACRDIIHGKPIAEAVGIAMKAAQEAMANPVPEHYTWHYVQPPKVNIHCEDKDGYCPVSTLDITYSRYKEEVKKEDGKWVKTGKVVESDNPWTITIRNFLGKKSPDRVSYTGKPKDEKKTTMYMTNEDMFDFCYRVEHFVSVWEIFVCGGPVSKKQAAIDEYFASRMEKGA